MPLDSIGVVARVLRIAKLVWDVRRRTLAALDMDSATVDLIATLRRNGPPYCMTPSALVDDILVSGPAITQRVARAEALGLVSVERTPSGRRTVHVTLTSEGHRTIERNIEELIEQERALLVGLTDAERAELETLLRKLLITMSPDGRSTPDR
ncbi:MarR family winged helix-turn-helix transcriptional regulator [Pseudonocardia sp. TRM90224]|uniref:MarR family winged helix-turn-helix transcriptional regulator n=1 Tax=Pseudonocardia sp. TRM90224 TaxID=2812678 RepID=UPI001E3598A8|nr:MarR family transcriptional regulator [Pseudonocardia sp. TRM90224]